jgi:RimJ/RimL family protein N-acetyltransferase
VLTFLLQETAPKLASPEHLILPNAWISSKESELCRSFAVDGHRPTRIQGYSEIPMNNDITLRDVQESDLHIFFEQQLDSEATRMAAFPVRDHKAFMAHWHKAMTEAENTLQTIVFGEEVAGNIVSWAQSGECRVGYWLGRQYWGKGIATAALSQFLGKVKERPMLAYVAKRNVASIRVLQKCGFAVSGEDKFPGADGEESGEFILAIGAIPRGAEEVE